MQTLILAAGAGTRLWPLTATRPKCMLPIGDKPLLERCITWLKQEGMKDIVINLHHLPEVVIDYFEDGSRWGVALTYAVENPIMGTAGGAKLLEKRFSAPFVVVYGDLLTNLRLEPLFRFHQQKKAQVTIALYRVEDPSAAGIVDMDARGRITRFLEKPAPSQVLGDQANAGVYVVEPTILKYVPPNTFFDFGQDLFPKLLAEGVPIYGYPIAEYLIDIGTLERYSQAQQDYFSGRLTPKPTLVSSILE